MFSIRLFSLEVVFSVSAIGTTTVFFIFRNVKTPDLTFIRITMNGERSGRSSNGSKSSTYREPEPLR